MEWLSVDWTVNRQFKQIWGMNRLYSCPSATGKEFTHTMRSFHLTFTGIFICIQRMCLCDTNISLLKSMIRPMKWRSYWSQGQCGKFRQIQEFWFTAGKNAEWGWHSWWGSRNGRQQSVGSQSAMSIDSQVCKLRFSLYPSLSHPLFQLLLISHPYSVTLYLKFVCSYAY